MLYILLKLVLDIFLTHNVYFYYVYVIRHKQEDQLVHIISGVNWQNILHGRYPNRLSEQKVVVKKSFYGSKNFLERKETIDRVICKRKSNILNDKRTDEVQDTEFDAQIDRIGIRQFAPIAFKLLLKFKFDF
jgi:hypothetical protein